MISQHAYVLRLWSEDQADGQAVWRIALLEPHSGHRLGFDSLSALVEHLERVTGKGEGGAEQDPPLGYAGDV